MAIREKQSEHSFVIRKVYVTTTFFAPKPKKEISQMIERAERGEILLLFEDEAMLKQHPTLRNMWSKKGEQAMVFTYGDNRKKAVVFGSADIITGKVHYTIEEKLNKASFLNHIRQLQKRYSDKEIVIVMDNHRTHRVRELEKIEKVKPYYLLPYSPDLNVIERLWKWLRERITHNFFFETLEELKKSIRNFFSYIANIKEQVALRLQFKV